MSSPYFLLPNKPKPLTHTGPCASPYASSSLRSAASKTTSCCLNRFLSVFWPGLGRLPVCVGQSEAEVKVQRTIRCCAVGWEVVLRAPTGAIGANKHMYTRRLYTQMATLWGRWGRRIAAGRVLKAKLEERTIQDFFLSLCSLTTTSS